jgi:nitroreductase
MSTRAQAIDVIDAIYTTGAQRRLRSDAVPDDVVWEILDAAIRGPSGGNDQPWHWLVVTDQAVKDPIAEWYLAAWNSLHRGRRMRLRQVADRVTGKGDRQATLLEEARKDPNYRAGEHLAINIGRAPVWIFAIVEGVEGTPTVVHGANIFGAVQNLMLAARAHGLGSTLTMLHRQHETEVAALLGLPADARALALVPIGYPESGRFFRTKRRPVENVVFWDRWGQARERTASEAVGEVAGVAAR